MRIKETKLYPFSELSEAAKEKALGECRDWNVNFDWWDYVYEDAKTIGKLMGIDIDNIWFSGFCHQGQGACFEGQYAYAKGSVRAIKAYAPQDKTLHRIARDLQAVQRRYFYGLTAITRQSGRSFDMSVDVSKSDTRYWGDAAPEEAQDGITEALTDFAHWIYNRLEEEYEYLTSDEAIAESLASNECEFTEDGDRA